jgi:hypothetical protein
MKFEHQHQKIKRWMPIINFKNTPVTVMELASLDLALTCYQQQPLGDKRKRVWDDSYNHSSTDDHDSVMVLQGQELHRKLLRILGISMQHISGCYALTNLGEVEFGHNLYCIGQYVMFEQPGFDKQVVGCISKIFIVEPSEGSTPRCLLDLGVHGFVSQPDNVGMCASTGLAIGYSGHLIDISNTTLVKVMPTDSCLWVFAEHHA